MIRHFTSAPAAPLARGTELGETHRAAVRSTWDIYSMLFAQALGPERPIRALGAQAYSAIDGFAPDLAEEIEGIARGAGLAVEEVAALNARTEILAFASKPTRGKCSTVVLLSEDGPPLVSLQTWDWHAELADSWLVWTIPLPGGRVVHTLTEYGIVGKIGVSSAHLGLHFNILHHRLDGGRIGVPVHVVARSVLDQATNLTAALTIIAHALPSASSALTVVAESQRGGVGAVSAEVNPSGPRYVNPSATGALLHTNHFLSPVLVADDREPVLGPDSWVRFNTLERGVARLAGRGELAVTQLLADHLGAEGALCCHPQPDAMLGDRYQTLATVSLAPARAALRVHAGGPCSLTDWWETPPIADASTTEHEQRTSNVPQ